VYDFGVRGGRYGGVRDMLFLTGDTRSRKIIEKLKLNLVGRMVIAKVITPYLYEPWAFDNGAYSYFLRGLVFNAKEYQTRMEKVYNKMGAPLFSVVPDIVQGGQKSLDFSLSWINKMPSEWVKYLAVQDGMTIEDITPIYSQFDGLFLGGSDKFKAEHGKAFTDYSHGLCKQVHYGRAGTPKKIYHAKIINVDSCDSAFPLRHMNRF